MKHSDDKQIFMFEDEVLPSLGAMEMLAFSVGDHLFVPIGKKIRTRGTHFSLDSSIQFLLPKSGVQFRHPDSKV